MTGFDGDMVGFPLKMRMTALPMLTFVFGHDNGESSSFAGNPDDGASFGRLHACFGCHYPKNGD
jgi:hypothetical protein